jgi:hypothetical protein
VKTDDGGVALLESSDLHVETAPEKQPGQQRPHAAREAQFDEIRTLYESGSTVREISRKLGLGLRRVQRWVCRIDFPERNVMAPKPSTPAYFGTELVPKIRTAC